MEYGDLGFWVWVMMSYFQNLFFVGVCDIDPVIFTFSHLVSSEMNVDLMRTYSSDEVKHVVCSMKADKLLGMNGFNPGFYKTY